MRSQRLSIGSLVESSSWAKRFMRSWVIYTSGVVCISSRKRISKRRRDSGSCLMTSVTLLMLFRWK